MMVFAVPRDASLVFEVASFGRTVESVVPFAVSAAVTHRLTNDAGRPAVGGVDAVVQPLARLRILSWLTDRDDRYHPQPDYVQDVFQAVVSSGCRTGPDLDYGGASGTSQVF